MKQFISKTIGFLLVFAIIFTSIPVTQVQAASKPVISSSQVKIKKNACSVKKGKKIKLTAKYGKKDITKKGTWKSSKKSVATISKAGVLTAKKAGTTYITVNYKGKTSSKLKVVVKANTSSNSNSASGKGFTITYNKNSKNKSDKLNGSATQKITAASGEILKFSTTVTPAKGKKFLGWYDAPTGGNRIYETYKPTGNMTLYAHYTDENTQQIRFSLGCNYGYTGDITFMGEGDGYDWGNKREMRGPLEPFWNDVVPDDYQYIQDGSMIKDRVWLYNYVVNGKDSVTIDSLPEPYIPGYVFKGWYTKPNLKQEDIRSGHKVENGEVLGTDVTALYARFAKQLTISFDDTYGGKYDDIVIDSYTSVSDNGLHFPVPNVPGMTFLGWSRNSDGSFGSGTSGMHSLPTSEDYAFGNVNVGYGFLCSAFNKETPFYAWHYIDYADHCANDCVVPGGGSYNDYPFYEETDHIILYPMFKSHTVILGFDPKGGRFTQTSENYGITIYEEDQSVFKKDIGYLVQSDGTGSYHSGRPYGVANYQGLESGRVWERGNRETTMPKVVRSNYIFDKWILPDGSEFTYDTMLTDDMILTAKWKPGNCYVMFDPTDGTLTQEERNRVGLDGSRRYNVTTESTISGSGKQLPVPVSSEGRKFEGWYTKDGEKVTLDTQILKDTVLYAHWGTKTDNKPETQKPSTSKDNSSDKNTESNNKNETVHATDITVTDMDWQPVDKNNNHYTIEYGGKGNQTGLGFTATVLPSTLKDTARNVRWTSSNQNIISVTAGKEIIYSPNWFDYFEFGTEAGNVVLTVTSMDNPNVSFSINVTVIKK